VAQLACVGASFDVDDAQRHAGIDDAPWHTACSACGTTMQRILDLVAERRSAFAAHPFFHSFDHQAPYDEIRIVVPRLAFWVLTFHDLLEMCEPLMQDPELRRIVRHHRGEESGHDRWYLDDLARLGESVPDSVALFGEQHVATRRASYRLMAEAIRSENDWVRIAMVLVMEATGAVFFTRAAAYRRWPASGLQFFSGHHLEVEKGHELFEQRMTAFLAAKTLDDETYRAARDAVLRGFAAFDGMFDGVDEARVATLADPS
jgi:hypothetical protein